MGRDELKEVLTAVKTLGTKIEKIETKLETDSKVSEMRSKITDQKIEQLEEHLSEKIEEMPTKVKVMIDADIKNCREIERTKMEEMDKKITDHELRLKLFEISFGGKNISGYSPSSKQPSDPYR
jgi:DNA-binding transcriptional MerR regulator